MSHSGSLHPVNDLFFYIGSFQRQQRTRKFTNTDVNFPDSQPQPPRRNDIVRLRIYRNDEYTLNVTNKKKRKEKIKKKKIKMK